MRVETGAVQFEGDHPGVFIRGDDALALAMYLETTMTQIARAGVEPTYVAYQRKLIGILRQCDAREETCNPLLLRSAKDCAITQGGR